MLTLTLPWPPRILSPNARPTHWSALARAKKRFRAACATQARLQGAAAMAGPPQALAGHLQVRLRFAPPDRRRRDLDNLIASIKAGLDGLADVLGVDDSQFRLVAEVSEDVGGFVRVEVTTCPA